ncbi:MAG: InlB B-repeat-containing protein [Treponematales bacterium]
MKNLCEHETAGNGPAITGGGAGASPAMRTPRRGGGGMKMALSRALRLVCVLASLAPLVGCELGFGSVLHKPPSGGDDGGVPGRSITLHLNGGDSLDNASGWGVRGGSSADYTYTREYTEDNLPITLPTPVPPTPVPPAAGYSFIGWFTDAALLDKDKAAAPEVPAGSTGDKTFWAKWEYTITLHLNGGDSLDNASGWGTRGGSAADYTYTMKYTITSGDITLPQAVYTNHSFSGWYTDKTLKTKAAPQAVPKGSAGNKDFYARYPYTVTFESNGGSDVEAQTALEKDDKITEPEKPTKEGYAFSGWYEEEALTTKWDFDKAVGDKDRTLYAKWDPAITLHLKGGDLAAGHGWGDRGGSSSDDYTYTRAYTESNLPITLPTPVPATGYSFAGWFTDAACTASAGTLPVVVPAGSTGVKTFYAKWEKIPTITLHLNGGDLAAGDKNGWSGPKAGSAASDYVYTKTYTESNLPIPLPTPEKAGCEFLGWYDNANLTGDPVTSIPSGSTGDMTFWAKWEDPWFYEGTPETGTPIDISGRSGDTRIDKAKTYLASADAKASTLYTLILDSGFSQTPVALYGLAASGITLVVTTRDDTAERVVELSGSGSLFAVGAGNGSAVTLRLARRVTLKGSDSNNAPLMVVNGTLEATGNAKITGNTNSSGSGGGVTVNTSGTFTLSGSASVSGNTAYRGGGVFVGGFGTFTMSGGSVSGNSASYYGGGVYVNTLGTFIMNGGSVSTNTASSDGGGVYVASSGTFTMDGGSVSNNTASGSGGGVYAVYSGGTFTMSGGSVSNNTASGSGGGVYVYSGSFTMSSGSVSDNSAPSGGGVFVGYNSSNSGSFTMSGGSVQSNTASSGDGGGVYVNYGTFTMNNSGSVSNNSASGNGGGVVVNSSGTFNLNGGSVSSNYVTSASSSGGGVFVYSGGAFTMSGGSVSGNRADSSGGGVFNGGTFTMSGGSVTGNYYYSTSASLKGGGVFTSWNYGTFTMSGSASVSGSNRASQGGGVYVHSGTFTMNDSASVSGNGTSITTSGGGVYVYGGTFTMNSGSVQNNTASSDGGGVFVNTSATFTMSGGEVKSNTGGGVYTNGTVSMSGSASVSYNTATSSGGGVFVGNGTFAMAGSASVSDNSSSASSGGGVYVHDGTFTMDGGSVSNNTASGSGGGGGGVYVNQNGTFTMGGSASVSDNSTSSSSSQGGGVFSIGTFTMNGSASVWGNTAPTGGGVNIGGATFTMNGGTIQGSADGGFTKNTATSGSGAALYVNTTNTTAKFGTGSSGCAVGSTPKSAGDDIVPGGGGTDETIVATGTGS